MKFYMALWILGQGDVDYEFDQQAECDSALAIRNKALEWKMSGDLLRLAMIGSALAEFSDAHLHVSIYNDACRFILTSNEATFKSFINVYGTQASSLSSAEGDQPSPSA